MRFRFVYTGVRVRDMERALRFYTEGVGMRLKERVKIPETGGEVATLLTEGSEQLLELNWYPQEGLHRDYREGDELDHLAFEVPALDGALEHLVKQGATVTLEPFREGGEWLAYVKDPDGIWIELTAHER
jgi:lactoylglutathione lyase